MIMSDLSGKAALVTGASRGIGRASSRLISRAACARHVVTVRRPACSTHTVTRRTRFSLAVCVL